MKECNYTQLKERAQELRREVIKMVGIGKTGHIGGSFSLAEIIAALYFHKLRHDANNPNWEDRDKLIFSKGHAAVIQYAALALCGYFPKEELGRLKELGAMLQGHPDKLTTPGIEANTGSLGQGLSIACGMAAGAKIDKKDYKVYCIVGDGELCEGQIWEAAMAAANYKLDNLVAIVDKNKLMATGPITARFDNNPVPEKWKAFGWHVIEVDGHDVKQVVKALDDADEVKGKPTVIIAHTIKGKGVSFTENNPSFHNGALTEEQYHAALEELATVEGVDAV